VVVHWGDLYKVARRHREVTNIMPKPPSFGHIAVGLSTGQAGARGAPQPDSPLRILLLGDWSGRARRGAAATARLADRNPIQIDLDNFDEVLARFDPQAAIPIGDGKKTGIAVRFREMEDFHPDRIYQRVEVFQALRQLRGRLTNPTTFSQAAAEMRGWASASAPAAPVAPSRPTPAPAPAEQGDLLAHILDEASPPSAEPASAADEWKVALEKIVEPYLLPKVDYTKQAQLVAVVDEAASRQMKTLLHHPDFQALESAWRGLHFLVRRLDTGPELKLYLLDVSREELAADLASEDLNSTGTYRLLVERPVSTPGGQPWGIVVGLYTFGPTDVELLGRMAKVAYQAGAPFLAAASPVVLGCKSLAEKPDPDDWLGMTTEHAEGWKALRHLPDAAALSLALPRFLLRVPYGRKHNPVEHFEFEEMPGQPVHEEYLWGNSALVMAYVLGREFSRSGWDFRPGGREEIEGLPLHVYKEAGESLQKPCAEAWLSNRAAEAILDQGLTPVQSIQGRDAICLPSGVSLASPRKALAGRWG
jgi:type VI secretion system protein ImpC